MFCCKAQKTDWFETETCKDPTERHKTLLETKIMSLQQALSN